MSLLAGQRISKAFGAAQILSAVDVSIAPEEKVGLVGANGSGKSTLGRILAGIDTPDSGTVSRKRGIRCTYLAQEPLLPEGSAREVAAQGLEAWYAAREKHAELSRRLEHVTAGAHLEQLVSEHAEAGLEVERLGGWEMLHRVEDLLARLNIYDLEQNVTTMSGGERRRVALARLLVSSPDLAILDEPTNHLDADTIEWLETYLRETFSGALLLITHDRYVLERVAERTLELAHGKIYSYDGGWERYLAAKAERQEFEARTEANRQNFLRRELEWLRRQPKARTTKQKARIDRAEGALAIAGPEQERSLNFETASQRLGSTILELADFSLTIADKPLIERLSFKLTQGERMGIIGKNGSGKSSLLRAIVGELQATSGQLVLGKNTAPAYFDQGRSGLVDEETILQNVAGAADSVKLGERSLSVYNYLERFSFQGDRLRTPVGALSGGERARVALAKLLLLQGNLLLLDEPTNDLDVQTLSALEEMLIDFRGVTLVVTHDRYFLNRVATSILAFEGDGKVTRYAGNFDDYLLQRGQAEQRAKEAKAKPAPAPTAKAPKRGLTHAEKRELAELMPRIETLETQISEIEKALADPKTYERGGDDVRKLSTDLEQLRQTVATALARWETLELKQAQ